MTTMLIKIFREVCSAVIDFLFPPRCPLCGEPTEKYGEWCGGCLKAAVFVRSISLPPLIDRVILLGRYRGGLRDIIHRVKYDGETERITYVQEFLIAAEKSLPPNFLPPADLVIAVPVPLYPAKEKKRGFNQAELFFAEWLKKRGIKTVRLLKRKRATTAQFGLTPTERRKNVADAFAAMENTAEIAEGKTILLLDDIMTSGSTLAECAACLKRAGVKTVWAMALSGDGQKR